jgi:hypothetical protein
MSALIRKYTAGDRSSDTTNNHGDIYLGDPVKLSSGLVLPANSGDTILGVVVGVGEDSVDMGKQGPFNADNLEKRYLGHADSGEVWVVPAEGVLFEVQSASDLDLVVGDQADITTDATEAHGSRTTGISSVELTTDSNSDVEVVEIPDRPDNDPTLANARYYVQFVTTQHAL